MTDTGRTHDFKMYKNEVCEKVRESIKINGDSGFQVICSYHKNSEIPKKKSKKNPLAKEEKANNSTFAPNQPKSSLDITGQRSKKQRNSLINLCASK